MTNRNEELLQLENISIKDIGNLSIVELLMLQKLLRHGRPIVRHNLFNEISHFLRTEQKKVVNQINLNDLPEDAQKFYRFLKSKKKFSSSSFYYSLDNLESKGLVKFNYDSKDKVASVEATEYTRILNTTVLKHIVKFGLLEFEQNKTLPRTIQEAVESVQSKKFSTMLYVWFGDVLDVEFAKTMSMITNNLFILSTKEVYENVTKFGLENTQYSSLFDETIRESDNFFDAVIIPFDHKNDNLYGISRENILKEAVRITKNNGFVILYGYIPIPAINHGILNVFTKWVKDIYKDLSFFTEEELRKKLISAGVRETKVFVHQGLLFGIGNK
ncbi:MAG: hypothetical protein ACFFDB_17545 [Promethearchaeota archaeon]